MWFGLSISSGLIGVLSHALNSRSSSARSQAWPMLNESSDSGGRWARVPSVVVSVFIALRYPLRDGVDQSGHAGVEQGEIEGFSDGVEGEAGGGMRPLGKGRGG